MNAAVQTSANVCDFVRITGTLTRHAELRMTTGERPHGLLFVELQTAVGLPFEVRQDVGTDPGEINAAAAKQRALHRGLRVTVYARGITPRTDHGAAVLRLHGVTDVVPEPFLTPRLGTDTDAPTQQEA